MSERQEQYDFAEAGHYTTHADPGDETTATVLIRTYPFQQINGAAGVNAPITVELGGPVMQDNAQDLRVKRPYTEDNDAALPARLLGPVGDVEAMVQRGMGIVRGILEAQEAALTLPVGAVVVNERATRSIGTDETRVLLAVDARHLADADRLGDSAPVWAALRTALDREAETRRLAERARQEAEARVVALEAERDAGLAHAARLAAALGPFADGWAQYERVHGAQEARRGVVISDGDTVGEYTRGQGRAAAAALAATPADSLARQRAERAVVEAVRAVKRQNDVLDTDEPDDETWPDWMAAWMKKRAEATEALYVALAALDAGEGRDGD